MSEQIRKVDPDAATAPAPASTPNVLGWFAWAMANRQKLWQIVLLISALFGGTVVGSYRQELTDVAVNTLPHSTEYQALCKRVKALEDNACECAKLDEPASTGVPEGNDAGVSVRVK